MNAEALVDTNVLVYAYDDDNPAKQAKAQMLLAEIRDAGALAAVSAQVLGEFSNVMRKKGCRPVTPEWLTTQLNVLANIFIVHPTTLDAVLVASRSVWQYGFSYYDAQIWAVARLNGIPLVISEDFEHGREVEGVRFENPFLA